MGDEPLIKTTSNRTNINIRKIELGPFVVEKSRVMIDKRDADGRIKNWIFFFYFNPLVTGLNLSQLNALIASN